jgi:hydrophobic/amphiphilic exporter-1 (mainly G- bacteria), HAE1 family
MLKWLLSRQTAFFLLIIILVGIGILLVSLLPVQLYPQTQRPRVRVRISHEGYSAVDFYKNYGDQIESNLLTIDGMDILQVGYGNNRSDFDITFNWEVDSEAARIDTEAAMVSIDSGLPADIQGGYSVRFFAGENAGYLMLGVTSDIVSPEEIYNLLISNVESSIGLVEDVDLVEIFNIEELNAEIILRQMDMLAYGLTIDDIDSILKEGYSPEPLGTLREEGSDYSVRFEKGSISLFNLEELLISDKRGVIITLKDIADVTVGYVSSRQTFVVDGERGVRLTVTPVDGGNIRNMSEEVQSILVSAREKGLLPADTRFSLFIDPADFINRAINNIVQSAVIGAILAMIIVFLTLGQLRNTLLILLSLPVTLILSFILMYVFKLSLNLISLGGIALAVGMVVDSSIVVMENIHRFRMDEAPVKNNKHLHDLIIRAVDQVKSPVIASILTSILVFAPISFTAPLTNAILGDQAKAVIFALSISLIVALVLIPIIASVVYRTRKQLEDTHEEVLKGIQKLSVFVMSKLVESYKKILRQIISRKWSSVAVILVSFGFLTFSIITILPQIPREIISPPSSDRVILFFKNAAVSDSEDIIDNYLPVIEAQIDEELGEYIQDTYSEIRGSFNRLFINLYSTEYADHVLAELQKIFVSDSIWYYNAMMWDPAQLPLPRTMDLQISIKGDDESKLVSLLEETRDLINESGLYGWTFTEPSTNLSDQLVITSRPEIIDGFPQFSVNGLLNNVRKILRGTNKVEFEEGNRTVSVSAEFSDDVIGSREKLANFLIPLNQSTVPLKHFFDFSESSGVAGLSSENGERIFRVYSKLSPGTPSTEKIEKEMKIKNILDEKLDLPAGYSVVFENSSQELDDSISSLYISLGIAIILIFLLLAFQFNSLIIPLVILVTVPLGLIGVIIALFVFKSTLSLNALLGTIMLAGIVVNNAIIMIDFYIRILPEYNNKIDALVYTAGLRFPPIIITTLTTIFGMLPIAIGIGEGSNIIQPLGIAVSGGLMISTIFTFFVVPSILRFLDIRGIGS